MPVVQWEPKRGHGLEHLVLDIGPETISAQSVLIGDRGGTAYGLSYTVECRPDWSVRALRIDVAGGASVRLSADGEGTWRDPAGRVLQDLAGCIDVDIAATPFTNTLPIRRLKLAPNDRRAIRVVYVSVPSLRLEAAAQAYTRLGEKGDYLYEGLSSRFRAELETDAEGLVIEYPTLFRRVL